MFTRIKNSCKKGLWYSLAMAIALLMAGPEILVGMELMALIEVLGASTFVLMYFNGLKLYLSKVLKHYRNFECYSIVFPPSLSSIKQMPSMLIHAFPERTIAIVFFGCLLFMIVRQFVLFL